MKKFSILFILFLPFFVGISTAQEFKTKIQILKIYDGDTVLAKIENEKFSVRLKGIDCYETSKNNRAYKQAYIDKLDINKVIKKGNEAKAYLKKLHKNANKVSFDFMGIDKYARALGVVWFDNLNVNEELKNKGYCMPYKYEEF